MRLLRYFEKFPLLFLILASFLFFLLRFPSLFEPYWYGDEGIYQTIGIVLNQGGLLYRDVWDNKPPLLYFFYSLFGSDQFSLRLFSAVFGFLGVSSFFLLAKRLLRNPVVYRSITLLFALLFGLPLIEGNIANAENFIIPLVILSAYLLTRYLSDKKTDFILFSSGIILGIAFLIKIVAVFDFLAFLIFLAFIKAPKKITWTSLRDYLKTKIREIIIFCIGFFVPFAISIIYFFAYNELSLYLQSMFFSNIGYVGWGNKLGIPLSLLHIKIIILALGVSILILLRNKLTFPAFLFILIWFAFSMFNTFFSQRPYPHYMLALLPSYCLLLGSIFIYRKLTIFLSVIFLISSFIVFDFFSLASPKKIEKNILYYGNFIHYILGNKDTRSYQAFFDRNTPRDYEIANFIKMNSGKEDNIFVWGNNAQLYKLTGKKPPGKYTVKYHISNYSDGYSNTAESLSKEKPKFLIIMPGETHFPFSLYNYKLRIVISGAEIYERII